LTGFLPEGTSGGGNAGDGVEPEGLAGVINDAAEGGRGFADDGVATGAVDWLAAGGVACFGGGTAEMAAGVIGTTVGVAARTPGAAACA
jgi:hypothetical protein